MPPSPYRGTSRRSDQGHLRQTDTDGEDAERKLKGYLHELDKIEQEIMSSRSTRDSEFLSAHVEADVEAWKEMSAVAHDITSNRHASALQDAEANMCDYEERLMMAEERHQCEIRMWELREQDLQEQFAFREKELKKHYEARIRELESRFPGHNEKVTERDVVDAPVSLGIDIVEEKTQMFFTNKAVKTHPGVRVIGVDQSLNSSIMVGDIITKISQTTRIGSSSDFRRVVSKMVPGDLVMVHIEKEGAERVYPIIAGGLGPAAEPPCMDG